VSVILSSHVLAELERVADYLVLLSNGTVQLVGEVDDLLADHQVLTGPVADADRLTQCHPVVHVSCGEAQAHILIRTNGCTDTVPAGWETHPVTLEELTLAYLREPPAPARPNLARCRDSETRRLPR
jgi:ABC-2 type transport system ATP-binding protein